MSGKKKTVKIELPAKADGTPDWHYAQDGIRTPAQKKGDKTKGPHSQTDDED